jgi:hypothetical protein
MDNMLAFVAKTIGTTARVGASIALGALVVAILRGMNVEPLASIDKPIYGAIVAAGILGACTVVVEFIIVFGGVIKQVILQVGIPLVATKVQRGRNRKAALKNLQTPRPEFVPTLRYLKANNLKRFSAAAPWRNIILREMVESFLIEIDDPSYQPNISDTYYSVPNYVWEWVERVEPDYQSRPVPEDAPWKYPKSRQESL